MAWSFRLARVRGIDIRVHWLTVAILGLAIVGSGIPVLFAALFTTLLFGSVLLHELGHGIVAQLHGIRVRDILLLPIGGVARLEEVPEEPWTEIKIALAGPAVNLVIFLLLSPVVAVLGLPAVMASTLGAARATGAVGELFGLLWVANFMIMTFNMLPAFPMDGGRVFRAAMARRIGYLKATNRAATVGKIAAFGLVLLGFFLGGPFIWLIVIGIFIFLAGTNEARLVRLRHSRPRRVVIDGMEIIPPESPDALPPHVRGKLLFDFGLFRRREVLEEIDRFLRGTDGNGRRGA